MRNIYLPENSEHIMIVPKVDSFYHDEKVVKVIKHTVNENTVFAVIYFEIITVDENNIKHHYYGHGPKSEHDISLGYPGGGY